MRETEEAAFARGVSAAHLMDEAGAGIAKVIRQFFPRPGHVVLYLGKGNNAGDALVAARHLADAGWTLHARPAFEIGDFKQLPAQHWKVLADRVHVAATGDELCQLQGNIILLDGLVGIGVSGDLQGALADAAWEMNELRRVRHAFTIALDIPSGLDSSSGKPGTDCVQADLTITIAFVKDILLTDEATKVVGRLAVVPLPDLGEANGDAGRRAITPELLLPALPNRPFEFHKGQAGRVGVIAGSRGFLGAAVLAANGALRGGAGLVTLLVKEDIYSAIVTMTPPEVMVKVVKDYRESIEMSFDAIAMGPGLGTAAKPEIVDLILHLPAPAVLDADALNMLAQRSYDPLIRNRTPRLFTPHPGEMARLAENAPECKGVGRAEAARRFNQRFPHITLLLKGARTVIASNNHPLCFNTTGHPGMASGGMGDTLTGLCAALLGQKVTTHDAACLGAWLSGRAAELALRDGKCSPETLSAMDVAVHLGAAFQDLRSLPY